MTTSNDDITRAIGNLEGTVKSGFKAIDKRVDGLEDTMKDGYDKSFDRINVLEKDYNHLRGGLKAAVIGLPLIGGTIGALTTWFSRNGF